jgi:ankyrin repeat protein
MASIEALPVKVISRIVDMCVDETTNGIKLSTKAQVALAQTNHYFYDIACPVIRATNICQAAEEGRLDIIKKAHQDGADLNMTGATQYGKRGTPLHYAIINGHRDILEFLVEVRVDPHVPSRGLCECWLGGSAKPYALHMSMAHSKIKGAAKLLIEKLGAYWSLHNMPALVDQLPEDEEERQQIVDLLINLPGPGPAGDALRYALHHHDHDLEERILARNDLDASVRDSLGRTPLFNAIFCGRPETVKSLLQHPEADADMAQKNGFTPLHAVVDRRSLLFVEALLQRPEVVVTKADDEKMTPFHLATVRGELAIVKLLLKQPGVDPASPDGDGMTPLHWAVRSRDRMLHPWKNTKAEAGRSFTEPARYRDESLEIIKILLARQEVNAGLCNKDGLTPLHQACLLGDRRVAELLLQQKDVDPNARDLNGQTPLHIAASCPRRGALMLMGRLLEQPGVEITDTDYDGRTILHYVCGNLPQAWSADLVIETALREGVPLDKESTNGLTAFHQAICSGNYPIAKFLLSLGADPMVSKRFKYNNSLLHLCLKGYRSCADHQNEMVEELISRGIEIDTYTDSPLYDAWSDENDEIESVEGIRSMDVLIGTDCTPLMLTAIGQASIRSMEMLLNAGADPNAHVIIRDLELEGKTKSNRQAFLSGVLRHTWDPEEPGDEEIFQIEETLKLLLKQGSHIDFEGSADSPLQVACKAAEEDRVALLAILLDCSTARNVSQKHVGEVICEYEKKPQHEDILFMLRMFEHRLFGK